MGRKIAAVLTGIVVAFSVVFVIELIPSRLYPPPSGLDFTQADVVANYMRSLPVAAFLWVLCGFILGAFTAAGSARGSPVPDRICTPASSAPSCSPPPSPTW